MLPKGYAELFAATAGTAGALTGLLFVAMSVAPHRSAASVPRVIQEIRAAAALLAFTNALSVALFSLVPGTNPGYPATVLGVIGIFFTAASFRSIMSSRAERRHKIRQLGLINLLLLIFGTELISGIILLTHPGNVSGIEAIGFALVASLLAGVARAWELVGNRDTGIFASIAFLSGHDREIEAEAAAAGADPPDAAVSPPDAAVSPPDPGPSR